MGMKNVLAAKVMDRLLFGEQQFSKRDRQRCQRLLNEGQLASRADLRQEHILFVVTPRRASRGAEPSGPTLVN